MKKRMLLSVLVLLSMMLVSVFPGVSQGVDYGVMDGALRDVVESGEQRIEVLIRFDRTIGEEQLHRLRSTGLETGRIFNFVNTVYAWGSPRAIMRASNTPGILAMVHNAQLEYHMDITTNVINATVAWHTMIQQKAGENETPTYLKGIDGTGVTVVVVDSGVDAGHPDLEYKVKTILNLKSNVEDGVWYEVENGDTSSGHGTHCAGTVAGSGEGSGGARAGVAPGANLIGLAAGELLFVLNALGGLEWTYENSRPGQNPHNIRAVTNSWGSSADYNREDPVNDAIRRITYENNVVVTFSAGNAGGENHDGSEVTTNPYSQEPAAISVAAATHDGTGMASFSSRGYIEDDFSWPDINAPGVAIWSTRPRRTLISGITADQGDAHYMAISGTSMSNPHVAGLVALLWQAAPSLRVSNVSGDNWHGDEAYFNDPQTNIHESELILKLTANYVTGGEGFPQGNWTGLLDKPKDFAQGYGLVDSQKAVALALSLEELRRDNPETTVLDAYKLYHNITQVTNRTAKTNSLETSWKGEWTQVSNVAGVLESEQKRKVWVPQEATKILAEIEYYTMKVDDGITVGELTLTCDEGGGGSWSTSNTGEIDATGKSGWWTFDIEGTGTKASRPKLADPFDMYKEARIDYTVNLRMVLEGNDTAFINVTDYHAIVSQWDFAPVYGTTNMTISLETMVYNLNSLQQPETPPPPPEEARPFPWWILLLIMLIATSTLMYLKHRKRREQIAKNSLHSSYSMKQKEMPEANGEVVQKPDAKGTEQPAEA